MSFGGSVKLTGASEYKKALQEITQNLKVVSAEMKATSSSFAVGDRTQKEVNKEAKEYSKALDEQKKTLAGLKNYLKDSEKNYAQMGKEHDKLVKTYENESKRLQDIKKKLGEGSKEYKDQEKVVMDLQDAVTKSSKAYEEEGKSIDKMRLEIAKAETQASKTAKSLDDLGDEAIKSGKDAKEGSDGFTVMKGVLANLSTEAINVALSGLKNLGSAFIDVGKDAVDSFADYEQLTGGIETLFGTGGKSIDEYAKSVGKSVDDVRDEYALLEEAQSEVMAYSDNAYKNAGLSANEYMETVTGFSASLIASLDGDTMKASEKANKAITDMADNANKMGSSMESIQNAYQGFAKQNYTMLDNLKLGYGGTKEEMQRLLKDAEKLSGQKFDLSNYADIVDAIHIIQTEMDITGTTAKESSSTISGATASMKSAWANMLTGMADENADFKKLTENFIGTLVTPDGTGGVLGNMVPRITQVIKGVSEAMQTLLPQLIETIVPIIQENLPIVMEALSGALETILGVLPEVIPIISDLIPEIIETLLGMLPEIIEAGIELMIGLIKGIQKAIPELIKMLPTIIEDIVTTLIENLPYLIIAGMDLMLALIQGIVDAIPQLIEMLPTIIETIVNTLIENLPAIIGISIQIMIALINGLIEALPQLIEMLPEIITTIVKTLKENWPLIVMAGKNLLEALIKGIKSIFSNLKSAVGEIWPKIKEVISQIPAKMKQWGIDMIQGLIDGIKSMLGRVGDVARDVARAISDFLHFSRPEKGELKYYEQWMPDFMQGMAKSLKDSAPILLDEVEAIASGINGAMNLEGSIGSGTYAGMVTSESMVDAFKEALSDMKIELDDEVAGKFVEKTVARAIYT